MEQYHGEDALQNDFNDEIDSVEKLKSLTSASIQPETNPSSGFECNICLDLVQDPVVTFCGHLYCWPCIYRWMNSQDENPDHLQSKCPVCKTEVSHKTLVPLYGRGQTASPSIVEGLGELIPHRPTTPRESDSTLDTHPRRFDPHRALPVGGGITHLSDPMIGMFGEMVYARFFGNSATTLYPYQRSYYIEEDSSSPRLRRYMVQTDTSLSRVCFFLFCSAILCLLLF